MYYQQPVYQPYPVYYSPVAQNYQMQNQQIPQQQVTQPVMQSVEQQGQQMIHTSNDFILVKSEEEARKYPVAPGNCVTFKDENAPYIYTKTMGFSQFDKPKFERIKLVKEFDSEDEENEQNKIVPSPIDIESEVSGSSAIKEINDTLSTITDEMESVHKDINYLRDKIEDISKRRKSVSKKVGENNDDAE